MHPPTQGREGHVSADAPHGRGREVAEVEDVDARAIKAGCRHGPKLHQNTHATVIELGVDVYHKSMRCIPWSPRHIERALQVV